MAAFTKDEYLERIETTKSKMIESGIEVLLVVDPANMNYLTGYDGWSFYTPQCVTVILDEDEPYWFGRGMDANGARHTVFMSQDHIVGYPDHLVQATDVHPMCFIANELRARGWDDRPLGVEMEAFYFTPRGYEELRKCLPSTKVVDCDLLVNWIRIVKSPKEIKYMQEAGQIAEKAMQAALNVLAPGVRECDAVATVCEAQVRGTREFGGDYPAFVPLMPGGQKASAPHLTWTDNPYSMEEAVNIELAGCRHRYHAPIARTVFLGKNPPDQLIRLADVTVEGLNLVLDAIKPGIRCEEVHLIWRRHIEKAGLRKESRIGYSMGLNYPPDWGEHTASLRAGDMTVLESNMTFHLILGMWMDDYGFECSESFRVTETGCATFVDLPRELLIKH